MLNVSFFTFNPFQENTYVIANEDKQCWIIDPGMYDGQETAQMIAYIAEKGLQPQAIINTHAHIDHIFGVQAMKDKYNIPFRIHEHEMPVLQRAADAAAMFSVALRQVPTADAFIKEGDSLVLGKDALEVYYTPGHSPGSISFYYPQGKWVIAGDVLFSGSSGRTDLPGGNFDTLISSIKTQLFPLPDETVVFSGHGPATNIGAEKMYNPFLQ